MALFDSFCNLATEYRDKADFLTIYIQEVHPTDGWAFRTNSYAIRTHKTIEERIAAARVLKERRPDIPVVVDKMDDAATKVYGVRSERLYVIHKGVVTYQGGRGAANYHVHQVEEFLKGKCS